MTAITTTSDTVPTARNGQWTQLVWFAGGATYSFSIPFVFSSLLDLQHDVYYAIYFGLALAALAVYVRANHVDLAGFFKTGWLASLLIGVPATAFVVGNALSRDSTEGPSGFYGAFEVIWRGMLYGSVDALLLTAFPALVALALIGGRLEGVAKRLAFVSTALVLTVVITATYHLGYEQFREDGVGGPELGNTIISVPTLVTGNPIGSIAAHASMHVAADVHSYETELFLPPQSEAP